MHCYEITQCDVKEECLAYQTGHTENGECRKYASFERLMEPSLVDDSGRIVSPRMRCSQCPVYYGWQAELKTSR